MLGFKIYSKNKLFLPYLDGARAYKNQLVLNMTNNK